MTGRLRTLQSRLQAVLVGRRLDRELDEELATHLQLLVDEGIRNGLSPAAARHAAVRKLGHPDRIVERHRQQRGMPFVDILVQDVRHAIRTLWKSPGFTAVVTVSLALGIGANTALFSLVDDLLLRSLPVPAPDRLFEVQQSAEFMGIRKPMRVFPEAVFDSVRTSDAVTAVVGFSRIDRPLVAIDGVPDPVSGVDRVSGNFFRDLGLQPALGRAPQSSDDTVAVISHRLWQSRFNRGEVLGRAHDVGPAFFETMGVALVRGRTLTAADFAKATGFVVNEAWVRRYSPNDDPVDRGLGILGVVRDVKLAGVRVEAGPMTYTRCSPSPTESAP
jgi:hypothetical protein